MKSTFKSPRRMASLLLLSVVLAACASGPNAPAPELQQRIEAARMRADHEGLAKYDDEQVVKARVSAENHRKMGVRYRGNLSLGRNEANIAAHCEAVARNQEGIAAAYEAMASGHRQMAQQAP